MRVTGVAARSLPLAMCPGGGAGLGCGCLSPGAGRRGDSVRDECDLATPGEHRGTASWLRWYSHSAPSNENPILPVSGYSATSGRAFVEMIKIRATSDVSLRIRWPPSGPLGRGTTSPSVKVTVTVAQTYGRLATEDDDQLLAAVVEVVDELESHPVGTPSSEHASAPISARTRRRAPTPPQSGTSAQTFSASSLDIGVHSRTPAWTRSRE